MVLSRKGQELNAKNGAASNDASRPLENKTTPLKSNALVESQASPAVVQDNKEEPADGPKGGLQRDVVVAADVDMDRMSGEKENLPLPAARWEENDSLEISSSSDQTLPQARTNQINVDIQQIVAPGVGLKLLKSSWRVKLLKGLEERKREALAKRFCNDSIIIKWLITKDLHCAHSWKHG